MAEFRVQIVIFPLLSDFLITPLITAGGTDCRRLHRLNLGH